MAGSVNKVTLIGNLGKDPEIRSTQSGERVANLTLATGESWTGKDGQRQERTEWHRVVCWNERLIDVMEKYCRKGSKIYIEGQLQTRKFTDNAGVERYQTEVVLSKFRGELTLLTARNDGEQQQEEAAPRPAPARAPGGGSRVKTSSIDDDSIPFAPCWQ